MRKYIYIGLFVLLCAGRASAQFTLVSGTVTDVNGLAYSCGTISASIVNNNGQSLYLSGVQFSPQPSATKLGCPTDPSTSRTAGAFTVQLADNTQIKCGSGASIVTCATQTQWLFTINTSGIPPPAGTGPQTCSTTLTISGASQNIASSLTACPALSNIAVVSSTTGQTPNTGAIYAGDPKYGVKANGFFVVDATIPNATSTATVTSATANFLNRNINLATWVCFATNAGTAQGTGSLVLPRSTISSINSATSISVSFTGSSTSTANAILTCGPNEGALYNQANGDALNQGKCLIVPTGLSITEVGCFIPPTPLTQLTSECVVSAGNLILVPSPSFDFTTCTQPTGACFFGDGVVGNPNTVLQYSNYNNIMIWGGGYNGAGYSSTAHPVFHFQQAQVHSIWTQAWATSAGITNGGVFQGPVTVENFWVLNSGTQGACSIVGTNGSQTEFHGNNFCQSAVAAPDVGVGVGATFDSVNNVWGAPIASGTVNISVFGTLYSKNDQSQGASGGASGGYITVQNGGKAYIDGWSINTLSGGGFGINVLAGGQLFLKGSTFSAFTGFNVVQCAATATCKDEGGNSFLTCNNTTCAPATNALAWPNTTCSTSGNGTCAGVTPNAGRNEAFNFRITAGTTSGATPTITQNFPTTFPSSNGTNIPTCTLTLANTGSGTWNARATAIRGTTSLTSVLFTLDNNAVALTAASTYDGTIQCQSN